MNTGPNCSQLSHPDREPRCHQAILRRALSRWQNRKPVTHSNQQLGLVRPFEARRFKLAAYYLHNRFQVPITSSVRCFERRRLSWSPADNVSTDCTQEFRQLLADFLAIEPRIGNAFAPALQLMVLGEEQKVPFTSLDSFVRVFTSRRISARSAPLFITSGRTSLPTKSSVHLRAIPSCCPG